MRVSPLALEVLVLAVLVFGVWCGDVFLLMLAVGVAAVLALASCYCSCHASGPGFIVSDVTDDPIILWSPPLPSSPVPLPPVQFCL